MFSLENNKENNIIDTTLDLSQHKFNLYQQFFIIGLDPKLMLKLDKIELKSAPESYLFPKIISKFPSNDLPYLNIPDKIIASHCFPQGIRKILLDNFDTKIVYQTNFIFSLENQNVEDKECSVRTNRLYFNCLLFYENIDNYHECINSKKNISKNIKLNLVNGLEEYKNHGLLIPKVICLSSFKPFFEQSKLVLENLKKYVDNYMYNKISKDNYNLYPIEKIIEGLIFNIPAIPRANFFLKLDKKTFETSIIDTSDKENNFINNIKKKIKDIENMKEIIFFENTFNQQPRNIINYAMLMKYFRIKEIFHIIKFILLEDPILFFCEDLHVLTYTIEGLISLIYPFEYQYPVISVLPEENYSFISIFKHFIFGINHKYSEELFQRKGIALEEKKYIIIIKIEKRFKKILNSDEEDKLDYSVVTSIVSFDNRPFIKIEQDKMNDDYENISDFPNIEEMINAKKKLNLPEHYFEKCTKRIEKNTANKFKEILAKNKNKVNLTEEEKASIFNYELRKNCIYFFSCILLRYQSFCVKTDKKGDSINETHNKYNSNCLESTLNSSSKLDSSLKDDYDSFLGRKLTLEEKYLLNKLKIKDIFKSQNFIDDSDTPKLSRMFYKFFFETKMFFNFIKKKIFPISIQDRLDVLYFDYIVNEKLTRGSRKVKIDTKFFSEEIQDLSGEVKINSLRKEPSEKMNEYFNNQKNTKNALNYFQLISDKKQIINNNNDDDNNDNNNDNDNDKDKDNNSDSENNDSGFCIISLHRAYDIPDNNEENTTNVSGKTSNANKENEDDDDIDLDKKKLTFAYYVFPKLLNDGLFYKENIFLEEFEKEGINLNNNNTFNLKNCNCLFNQFEKQANIFIKKPIIHQNYKIYGYNINNKVEYKYKYEECISKLWLLYLAKTFHYITPSKKRYYFETILMFLNDKNNRVDQNTILLLFNAINKYGDKSMNQELFIFLEEKKYINFCCLQEKAKPDNNFMKYINNNNKYYLEKGRGSYTQNDIINKFSEYFLDSYNEKINQNLNKKLFEFFIYTYCSPDLEDSNINANDNSEKNVKCGKALLFNSIKDLFQSENNKRYIEIQCPKCKKIQNVTISCFFNIDNGNKYQLNFNLISPLALLNEPWFKDFNKVDTLFISKEYPEEYLSALFYFYEQGLPCNFLIPKGVSEKKIKQERATTYNNIDPIDDYLSDRLYSHKKSFSILNSPRYTKRELASITERLNNFDVKKAGQKSGGKSPSPKKSSLMKRSKFGQKIKSIDIDIKPKVTFSCFKK